LRDFAIIMTDNYTILIGKLDAFIRKYYKNQIIRGLLYSVAVLLLFFLTITFLEFFAWFGTTFRTIIFYLYLIVSGVIIFRLILIPVFKLFKIGKIISHKQAAQIIGKHFTNVEDKLLNTLQLKELSDLQQGDTALLQASIDQRIARLQPVPFSSAIDLRANRKYLKYAITPVLILVIFLFAAPGVITGPTARIIHHNQYFERQAPFRFVIQNEQLQAVQQENFKVELLIEGGTAPATVMIEQGSSSLKMKKEDNVHFSHTFRNLNEDVTFSFQAEGFRSEKYTLRVLPKPIILSFDTELTFPKYTGKTNETIENTGDLVLPEGSSVRWKFYTRDAEAIHIQFIDSTHQLAKSAGNVFSFQNQFFKSQPYSISISNQYLTNNDSLLFAISIIPDIYPTINIDEFTDNTMADRLYYRGLIKDDYGFRRLAFFYRVSYPESPQEKPYESMELPLQNQNTQQQFFHAFDLSTLQLAPGDEVEYYFEVWDNDAINGSKSARSQKMIFKTETFEELQQKAEAASTEIKDNMESAMKDLKLLQRDIDELSKQLFEKKSISWQEKQQIEDLLTRQKNIKQRLEEMQELNEQKLQDEQKMDNTSEELLEKQRELEKMMNELLTDDMKKMLEEIQKLLDELDKDKVNEMMQEMKMSNKELEEQLDRNLELFKQLEFEKQLQETIDKLKELAEEQDKLAEETSENNEEGGNEELKEKQEGLNEKFEEVRKDIEELKEKNEALDSPNEMDDTNKEEEEIQESMEESSEQLEQNENSKASQSQKKSSQKMQELSQKMQQMMQAMQMEQMGEDIDTLREILENLIQISFNQEDLMLLYAEMSNSDPKYNQTVKEQKEMRDDMEIVADSLKALAKRQIMIKPFVMKELTAIDGYFFSTLESMDKRQKGLALRDQQLAMTSINNLALLLSESLQQMQQQMMSMQASGKSSCPNPGQPGGAQQMKSMRGLQEQLNQQLQQLRDGQKPGKQGQQGQQMSEQLARMAAQQAAIRRQMEEFRDELKGEGRFSDGNISKMIDDMEKTEKDIVNDRITQQTLQRQQEILTRLLKSEKAEQEREEEQRRESREARDITPQNPGEFFEYNKIKNREMELLKTLPPNLKPFYKNKVTEYFYRFE